MYPLYPLAEVEAAYLSHHRRLNHSTKTVERYQQTFRDFHRFLTATKAADTTTILTTEGLAAFSTWLRETPIRGWRGSTVRATNGIHGRLRDMKAFCRWLAEEDLLEKAPKVPLPKLPQALFEILTDQQIDILMHCQHLSAPGDQAIRNHALIALMIETGLRLSEVASIKLADVEFDSGSIKVWGKGSKQRRVFFTLSVEARLLAWLKVRDEDHGPELFQLTSIGIQQVFVRIRKETGLPIHPHMLRHQAATSMVRSHANIHTVQRILGHSSVTVTEKYLSLADEDLRAQHAAASPYERIAATLETPKRSTRRRLSLTK